MNPNTNTAPASMAMHTPTPWRLMPADDDHCFDYVQIAPRRFIITEGRTQDEACANAAFIVRACNSHAQLVAALEWTQKIICAYLDAETQAERDYLWKDIEHAHKTNNAALTAATEGGAM